MVPALITVLSACAALIAGGGAGEAAAGRSAFLPAAEARPAVAVAADLASDGDRTHLVFTLSREVAARVSSMERPDRVIVDLPEVTFHLPAETTRKRAGLVASFRYGLFAPGRSRVVIELAQPALVSRVDVASDASGLALLRIELIRADRQAFRKAAETGDAAAEVTATGSAAPAGRDPRPLVAIDPGHGGIDPGAIAVGGALEKEIVFGFAENLRRRLEGSGRYRVVMTRGGDAFVALDERVRIARDAKADLLISIHADSISAAPHIRGLTVYTGSEQASDTESQRLAERENKADAAAGLDPDFAPGEVADILQELTVRETRSFSQRFGQTLVGAINPLMPLSKKPQRQAAFRVLRAPDVPSVLVELGYLSSSQDIDLLLSETWRDRSTAAMASAIDRFFATRVASGRTAPVSP
ncbi:MAG TPA: N-acetylmuramoyl-L-alanine amidase [Beijerinckiaceae bacterium]|nr:N-acetylmuramoyl-L-alanine amidase [Beijerinckiaceae bacterium]